MTKMGYYQYTTYFSNGSFPEGSAWQGWVYEIYSQSTPPELLIESQEWFDSQMRASFAAIGHISLIENGESYDAYAN